MLTPVMLEIGRGRVSTTRLNKYVVYTSGQKLRNMWLNYTGISKPTYNNCLHSLLTHLCQTVRLNTGHQATL